MKVTAEEAETEEQAEILHIKGCTELWAYLFSRPVSPTEFLATLRLRTPGKASQAPAGNENTKTGKTAGAGFRQINARSSCF